MCIVCKGRELCLKRFQTAECTVLCRPFTGAWAPKASVCTFGWPWLDSVRLHLPWGCSLRLSWGPSRTARPWCLCRRHWAWHRALTRCAFLICLNIFTIILVLCDFYSTLHSSNNVWILNSNVNLIYSVCILYLLWWWAAKCVIFACFIARKQPAGYRWCWDSRNYYWGHRTAFTWTQHAQ